MPHKLMTQTLHTVCICICICIFLEYNTWIVYDKNAIGEGDSDGDSDGDCDGDGDSDGEGWLQI